jgi:hypothetical protein
VTNPSDPNNKVPGRFPRPEDATVRPAVVGGPAQGKSKAFKATMVGVAPPASPVAKGLGSSPSAAKPPSAPRNVPPSAPREPPKRPPPFRRERTMMGISPGPAMPLGAGESSAEPISLDSPAPPPAVVGIDDVPIAAVTRDGSEPEIGSVQLAMESVVAAGDVAAASIPPGAYPSPPGALAPAAAHGAVPPSGGMGATMPEAAYTRGAHATGSGPAEPVAAAGPAPYPMTNQQASGTAPFAAPPGAQPFGVQLQQAPPYDILPAAAAAAVLPPAPIPVYNQPKKKSGGALGLVLGIVCGVVALAGIALAGVWFLLPDSDVARGLRALVPFGTQGSPAAAESADPLPQASAVATADAARSAEVLPSADVAGPTGVAATADGVESAQALPGAAVPTSAEAIAEPAPTSAPVPSAAIPEPTGDERAVGDDVPETVNRGRMEYLVNMAARRAEQCHLSGRAVGTATAFVTFASDGIVVDARLEGEPIASAPVATCILNKFRSVIIKPYEGPPFTHSVKIRLK